MSVNKPLLGAKVAILVANGFNEEELTAVQRALLPTGANMRIISPEQGLVNGWTGKDWGHHYAIDSALSAALGADYSMLVVPSGVRSLAKLRLTAHTKRFIGSFMAAGKPVAIFSDAVDIMIFTDNVRGRTLTCPDAMKDTLLQAGADWSEADPCIEGNLMTISCTAADQVPGFFISFRPSLEQAA